MSAASKHADLDSNSTEQEAEITWTQRLLNIAAALWLSIAAYLLLSAGRFTAPFGLSDTVGHILLFFGISLTITAATIRHSFGFTVRLIGGLAVLAVVSELAQNLFHTGRVGELRDIRSDLIGIAIGSIVTLGLRSALPIRRAQGILALASAVGLIASLLVGVGSTTTFQTWWQCRGESTVGRAQPVAQLRPALEVLSLRTVEPNSAAPPPAKMEGLGRTWCRVMANNGFTVSTWVRPLDLEQRGPTRIVSSSTSTEEGMSNFHLGQQSGELTIRIRTGDDGWQQERVPDVFVDDRWQHLVFRYDRGVGTVFVDGEEQAMFRTHHRSIANWDKSFPFLAGDELTRDRSYIGSISDARFFTEALTDDDIERVSSVARTP